MNRQDVGLLALVPQLYVSLKWALQYVRVYEDSSAEDFAIEYNTAQNIIKEVQLIMNFNCKL